MAEGDRILIETIHSLSGLDLQATGFERLSDFTPDFVLQSVARCLNAIFADDVPFKNVEAPVSMPARYKMGTKLADTCASLGYPNKDIGYQTFLYGNEKDLRSILMFVVDKIPKDVDTKDKSLEGSEQTFSALSPEERTTPENVEKTGECDEFCSCDACLGLEVFKSSENAAVAFLPKETRASYDMKRWNDLRSTSRPSSSSRPVVNRAVEPSSDSTDLDSSQIKRDLLSRAPDGPEAAEEPLNPEPSKSEENRVPEVFDAKGDDDVENLELERILALQMQVQELEEEVNSLKETYLDTRNKSIDARKAILDSKTLIAELEERMEKEKQAAGKRGKLLTLLPECEENIVQMAAIVEKNRSRLEALSEQWHEHQTALDEEFKELKRSLAAKKDANAQKMSDFDALMLSVEDFEEQIKEKNIQSTKYSKEVAKLSKNYVSRSTYTKQIMDILNNVSKQRHETSKVINDIRSTQNDINLMEGKLSRTFFDVDSSVFQLAFKDAQMIPAYKIVTEINKKCDAVIEGIRQTGQLKRATRMAKDQADAERTKNVATSVEQLARDLQLVKDENMQLRRRLETAK